ncbi:MAG: hypothetical protein NC177_12675 [Ruminococcus flavefaciens]|nr:hypothetical protein [Ruminococcus flavefaciens]
MIRSKKTDFICIVSIFLAFVIAIIAYTSAKSQNVAVMTPMDKLQSKISTEYETKLFDSSYVHEIDIIISDVNWDYMTKNAVDEQYVNCDLKIDGEMIYNVAIRPKGNSSLGTISNMGSTQFSFKIEFDQNNPE